MTAPTVADYQKYADLQMAAEALYGYEAIAKGVRDINFLTA